MLIIIVVIIILSMWLIATYVLDNRCKNSFEGSRFFCYAIGIVVAMFLFVSTLVNQMGNNEFPEKYRVFVEMMEHRSHEQVSPYERLMFVETIDAYNRTIVEHRTHYKNKWVGKLWYSEEIANLPYIK